MTEMTRQDLIETITGLEADLEFLVETVRDAENLDRLKALTELNYPELFNE